MVVPAGEEFRPAGQVRDARVEALQVVQQEDVDLAEGRVDPGQAPALAQAPQQPVLAVGDPAGVRQAAVDRVEGGQRDVVPGVVAIHDRRGSDVAQEVQTGQ